jgi:hypothetical protein
LVSRSFAVFGYFRSELLASSINNNFEANHGEYHASKSILFNIPKANFTLRYALETSIADRFLYHALASKLVPFFDELLGWQVFSHRFNRVRTSERYIFCNGVKAWKDFVDSVKSSMTEENILLSTDLTNYFENIRLSSLRKTLLESVPLIKVDSSIKAELRAHIHLLFDCLKVWAYKEDRGLPQNRDASSFLANMYMLAVDSKMIEKGYKYYRYMDDIKIVCETEFQARQALKDLSIALREIELAVNSKKTEIIHGSDKVKINEALDTGSIEIQQLDAIWKSHSRDAIARSFSTLQALTHKLIANEKTDSREFRFCIGRLEILAKCEDFHVPEQYFESITPHIVNCLKNYPAASDQFLRYLLAVPLTPTHLASVTEYLCNADQSVYSWQNYRNWIMLAEKPYLDKRLVEVAEAIVKTSPDNPTRAGATIYLGALADKSSKVIVAKAFNELKSFLGQRSAIIAVHELPFEPYIKEFVKKYIRPDLVGVFRELGKNKGQYFSEPEKVYIDRSPDTDRSYD